MELLRLKPPAEARRMDAEQLPIRLPWLVRCIDDIVKSVHVGAVLKLTRNLKDLEVLTIVCHQKSKLCKKKKNRIVDARYTYVAFWYVKMSLALELESHLCHLSQFLV